MKTVPERNPVILVHGLWDTQRVFQAMSTKLRTLGWPVYSLDMIPANGDRPLTELAQQLKEFIDRSVGTQSSIDLVGFSMGGIVGRYYLQRLRGADRTDRLITVSSPHQGTLTGYGSRRPGCRQMRPQSDLLKELNHSLVEDLSTVDVTSIWTPYDAMILPARSSKLPIGQEVVIPGWLHGKMISDPRVIQQVVQTLNLPVYPQSN